MTTEITTKRITYKIVPSGEGKIIKREQSLPQDVLDTFKGFTNIKTRNQYIIALKQSGWTDSAIARAVDISRERVRQIAQQRKLHF
jgi:DNA-directed RNA polymerase sigma subunit (sigma70/sigma32)